MNFIPGLELSARYYNEVVRPILESNYPELRHSAALIGHGSEVLGFDTPQSMDHDWGPRVLLFIAEEDNAKFGKNILETLHNKVPEIYLGFPTRIKVEQNEQEELRVEIHTVESYFSHCTHEKGILLNINKQFNEIDWLTFPQQELLTLTAGKVHHDGLGTLTKIREKLS